MPAPAPAPAAATATVQADIWGNYQLNYDPFWLRPREGLLCDSLRDMQEEAQAAAMVPPGKPTPPCSRCSSCHCRRHAAGLRRLPSACPFSATAAALPPQALHAAPPSPPPRQASRPRWPLP